MGLLGLGHQPSGRRPSAHPLLRLIARPWGLLESARPNLTRFVFTDQRARQVFPDWNRIADERAFDLWLGPSLERSSRFREELAPARRRRVHPALNHHTPPQGGVLCWVHPAVGELRLDREVMELPATDAQQLVVFVLPADAATADAVDQLRRAATPLRAVP